jgi:SAM-dependent methyltransferase
MSPDAAEFDRELARGLVTYNGKIGQWWRRQASNRCHDYAYRKIADFVRTSFPEPPGLILDYACGTGSLLLRLREHFPSAGLLGVDGSALLLGVARGRIARNHKKDRAGISLLETPLPNFKLPRAIADVVTYVFPNMVPVRKNERPAVELLNPTAISMARHLAWSRDADDGAGKDRPAAVYANLLCGRLVSLNLRHLLKPGGICVRVEYGSVRRAELTGLELLRVEFEEGSLGNPVGGSRPDPWFRVLASCYFRSRVIEDVYHQSREEADRSGGYCITVLRALSDGRGRVLPLKRPSNSRERCGRLGG